ncbi:DUF202 domain-containing protein [Saccharopolyspora erythraea]|uniref:YidH family protein n=1 Tax=Saccharopolyspora erythraea TaxID=1836 RepID=UPI001BA51B72|nr:DUF202 domain-containing protein [Saccharopolyspora erythraea]QUH04779.1 DUF202 domain-containing protein [Saccharopolyspora erythraea]
MSGEGPEEPRGPWDPGLQNERTTLAWLRTILSFAVGLLVLLRLIAHNSLAAATACAVFTLPLCAGIALVTWRRHRRTERSLRAEAPLPDGILPAAVAVLAVLGGCTGLVYVLTT